MIKFKRNLFITLGALTTISVIATTISCGKSLSNEYINRFNLPENIAELNALKNDPELMGYSTEALEIMSGKQEIQAQSKALVEAFNSFFGTKLSIEQYGNTNNIGQAITTRFSSSDSRDRVLLVGSQDRGDYNAILDHMVDTDARVILKGITSDPGELVLGNKKFMSYVSEAYGVIYNIEKFKEAGITVYEGKAFEQVADKPTTLVKPATGYNGTIVDGTNLYVFTDDLTKEGWLKINATLESKNINPIYSLSRADTLSWPITAHLLNSAISTETYVPTLQSDGTYALNFKDETAVITPGVITAYKDALEIYGGDKPYNRRSNTVDAAMVSVAVGQFAMSQNGTWASPQIAKANPNAKVGFLPVPVFNKVDNTAMMYENVTTKWGITKIAEQDPAKMKLAKLFLRFLYQTKIGVEIFYNDFSLVSPYPTPNSFDKTKISDQLLKSLSNYGPEDKHQWASLQFPKNFDSNSSELIAIANDGAKNANSLVRMRNDYKAKVAADPALR